MDEIEYKLNTNNSVLVVNAVDKLISTIKLNYKPADRKKFVLENEELKVLREKCASKDNMVSLTACQGLLALVELGVLEIAYTMSTVVTLLPSAHNYSAIISTMAGLLVLDLKSRLVPGQPYKCQFFLKSPQHPFITVLEKNKDAEKDVLTQMHALCTHPDYNIASNSLELVRPVFFYMTCNPQHGCTNVRPWQLLLGLPYSAQQHTLLLDCIACQQICNPKSIEGAFAAYSAVTETFIYQKNKEYLTALLPMLARVSNELVKCGMDPRACYSLLSRGFALGAAELAAAGPLVLAALANNLPRSSALYLYPLFSLALNIISKYEYSTLALSSFLAASLQWLHLPSHLTSAALKVASKILETHETATEDSRPFMTNLKSNKVFQTLLYTDKELFNTFKFYETWERIKDKPDKLRCWFDAIESLDDYVKLEMLPFMFGIILERKEEWFEETVLRCLKIVVGLVDVQKELAVQLLPILLYKIANDKAPKVKFECLKAVPLMAKSKENVPTIVSVLNKLKVSKGVPASLLINLYASLAEVQVRCFPYLQEIVMDNSLGRPDDLKWETDVARASAVNRICELRPSSHGVELVSVISSLVSRCSDAASGAACALAVTALRGLWRGAAVAPRSAWHALRHKLADDQRRVVQISVCNLLGEIAALRVSTPEYDKLIQEATGRLWRYIAESNVPEVVEAACDALANFKIDDYTLKQIPEVYRHTVTLPASYCKTPMDAARDPADVLDYIPCEIWPEVFKFTNQAGLAGLERLCTRLVDREIRLYRSGVYQPDTGIEPETLSYLPNTSVARGLFDALRKQAISPSYDFPDTALLSAVTVLAQPYPRPLPPAALLFLPTLMSRSQPWRLQCALLAARQALTSSSAPKLLEGVLRAVLAMDPPPTESDILVIFEILPSLCRGMPPNSLRGPIEKCLGESYAAIAGLKAKNVKKEDVDSILFVKLLRFVKVALDSDKIHDANRTLLSQILETYYELIPEDNVAWSTYISTATSLSAVYVEKMSSPSSWWETTPEQVRRSAALLAALDSLVVADLLAVTATMNSLHEFMLTHLLRVFRRADPRAAGTTDWFLRLLGATQSAFKQLEDQSAKLHYFDAFMLSVIVFSGRWSFEPDSEERLVSDRHYKQSLLPAAVAALLARPEWKDCTLHTLEWLCHTRDSIHDGGAAMSCQRTLLALRHTEHFAQHRVWTRLETYFGRSENLED